MTAWLQAAATVAALVLMYLVCIRPMMRSGGSCHRQASRDPGLDEQISRLREEVAQLRHEVGLDGTIGRPHTEGRPRTS